MADRPVMAPSATGASASGPPAPDGKLGAALATLLPRLGLAPGVESSLAACRSAAEALPRLEAAGLLEECVRLVAHALPAREAVWWACMCAQHTAAFRAAPGADAAAVAAAELWVRRPEEAHRRAAMARAGEAGFGSAEAWCAVGAFWCGDSMAPPEAPKVAPEPHFPALAVGGSVLLSAVRGLPARRDARLRLFLGSARAIAAGGPGRLGEEAA